MIERLLAADAALDRGELDVAERLFTQVVVADPRNAIAVVGRARVAMQRDERAEAADLAQRALDIDPHEAAAHRLLAELAAPAEPEAPTVVMDVAGVPLAPTTRRRWWRRLLSRILGRG